MKFLYMKKIIVLLAASFFFVACEDDDNGTATNGYPTDGLALPETKNALMIGSYAQASGLSLEILRATAQDLYPGQLNYFSVVANQGSPLYNGLTDSISLNQPLSPAPSVYLNEGPLDIATAFTSIEKELNRRPVASVNHAIGQNDTAWVIDSKVKFWRDTTGGQFYIETYLASSMIAANYQSLSINLQTSPAAGFIRNQDTVSVWDADIPNADSSSFLFNKEDAFYHPMILSSSANSAFAWGVNVGDYTPFGLSFSVNDVIGTETTPIRHYILKPDSDIVGAYSPGFEFTPTFVTVIWALNVETAKFEYINSISTTL
jgi:hypothetical protein